MLFKVFFFPARGLLLGDLYGDTPFFFSMTRSFSSTLVIGWPVFIESSFNDDLYALRFEEEEDVLRQVFLV